MLTHEEDQGILWVSPLFAAIHKVTEIESTDKPIVVTVDDCECIECELERGPIEFISTLLLYIPTKKGVIVQRMTPNEAEAIGKSLIKFSQEVLTYKEELNEG